MTWKIYSPGQIPLDIGPTEGEWLRREFRRISEALNYQAPRWEDLRFPASNLTPGTANTPTWDDTNGLWEFAVSDELFFQAQMPHSWKEGSAVYPHVHWQKITSAAGNVNWRIDYRVCRIGEVWDSSDNLADETPDVTDNDTARTHALTALGEISMTGAQVSDMIIGKLSRVAAAGTEYGTRAALLEFDIHILVDSFGSELEYIKTP